MENNQNRVYLEDIVRYCHANDKLKKYFQSFLNKDYEGKKYQFETRILSTLCLDIDDMETELNGDNNNTMDFAIGISNYNDIKQTYNNKRLLPVELKLRCTSINGIKKQELIKKDRHTRDLLASCTLDKTSVFIFNKDVSSVARNGKERWAKEPNSSSIINWEILNPSEFNKFIGFKEDFPHKTITDLKLVSSTIRSLYKKKDYEGCINYIERMKYTAEEFKNKFELYECITIANLLEQELIFLSQKTLPEEILEYLDILRSDIKALHH